MTSAKRKLFYPQIPPVLFSLFVLILCIDSTVMGQVISTKPDSTAEIFARGKALFSKQCSVCHGMNGAADGPAAYLLYPKPRDFTRNEFRLVSTTQMKATDEDLFKTITRGMPGSSMPSWEHLSEQDRWALVFYVRYLAEFPAALKAGIVTGKETEVSWDVVQKMIKKDLDPASLIQIPAESAITPEGVQRGKALFIKACASCHGPLGKGDGQQKMKDSLGYPIMPRDLTAGIFKGASSPQELYYRILAGLPGSPMPSYNKVLTDEQIWDLIHYVRTLPQPGAEEKSRLRVVKITVKKASDSLDFDPLGESWSKVEPVFIPMTSLWWRNERVEGVEVRALYDKDILAIHVSWPDPTQDTMTTAPQLFSDGAAIQLSDALDPPAFSMGGSDGPVTLWHWKAAWQEETKGWRDVESQYPNAVVDGYLHQTNDKHGEPFELKNAKTQLQDKGFVTGWGAGNPLSNPDRKFSAEEARAKGLGSLTTMKPEFEQVDAQAIWKEGRWQVVFHRSLHVQDKERIQFETGAVVHAAFAVWDGSHQDRNGQKSVSIWNELTLE